MQSIDRLTVIGRTYRHLNRYQQIAGVLFSYGFGDLLDTFHVRRYLEAVLAVVSRRDRRTRRENLTRPERVCRVLEELGPTFVKLGQVLSTRPDLVPLEYTRELSRLQDRVEPFPLEAVLETIQEELGRPASELFAEFGETPTASASISQGHRAVLHDGTEVFVKVQRPGIRRTVAVDLEIMMHLAEILETHSDRMSFLRPTLIVAEFQRTLEREMDFTVEFANVERFRRQFEGTDSLYVPRVFEALSGTRVLTQEYIHGIKASEIDRLRGSAADLRLVAARGAGLLMAQFFDHGFFHADPHPGNVYVLPGNVICYVDFGMMGRISLSERENIADLLLLAVKRDERRAVRVILGLTTWEKEPDRDALERDLGDFIDEHLYRSLGRVDMPRMLQRLYTICRRHSLTLRPHIYLVLKTLGTMDEMGRRLDPEFRVLDHLGPYVKRLQQRRLSPMRLLREALRTGAEGAGLLQDLPGELRGIFRQVREGRVKVEFEHRGLDGMLHTHERISNRIASSIVLAAMIIGSSLLVLSGIPPKWQGMPILGLGGFLIAAILGLWLLWSMLRSGRE
ncbi:MAG: AarF/ABC1/UbiB kinase family protein [Lentisphaeria bacterium]|nr:AarF/ABC1/UbiB kinase family protein [Lentisphaeria bacterium]